MPNPIDIPAVARSVRKLFRKHGWRCRTDRSLHTPSVYIVGFGRISGSVRVRISDHPPSVRHRRRRMILLHPGGEDLAAVDAAIRLGRLPDANHKSDRNDNPLEKVG